MDKEIKTWVATCTPCQESRPAPRTAPTHEWESPKTPWSRIHIYFAGPCQGHTFLIIVDAYSKLLKVSIMTLTMTETIRVLRKLFATTQMWLCQIMAPSSPESI
uniref:Integrase catalytic domain-containing protein n=1 Tax=Micrurus paraensis TaxID=1970185 RepID=A0A2D4KJL3_9SAUR